MGHLDDVARRRIASWRQAAGLTQKALAERIGRNPVWISRYFDNAYDADLDTLHKLALALGRTITDLLGPDAPPTVEAELLERFRSLNDAAKKTTMEMVRVLTPGVVWPLSEPPPGSSPLRSPEAVHKYGKRGSRQRTK